MSRLASLLLPVVLSVPATACDEPISSEQGIDTGALLPDAALGDADAGIEAGCHTRMVRRDFDGDGQYGRFSPEETLVVCLDAPNPPGFADTGDDCDDRDPQLSRWYCVDRDGDGAYVEECGGDVPPATATACVPVVEWTPEPGPYDCDDTDPARIDYHYRDADNDGRGTGEPVCASDGPGWSAFGGDCDDLDPKRSPSALEWFDDGVDSNCDGRDDSRCKPSSPDDVVWAQVASRACGGVDVALGYVLCSGCFNAWATLAVQNRGALPIQANARFMSEGQPDIGSFSFPLELDVEETKLIVSGPFRSQLQLLLSEPLVDCNTSDNTVDVPGGHCI